MDPRTTIAYDGGKAAQATVQTYVPEGPQNKTVLDEFNRATKDVCVAAEYEGCRSRLTGVAATELQIRELNFFAPNSGFKRAKVRGAHFFI
jgi:hypothetical protein